MYHTYEVACGSGNKVDFLINLGKNFLKYYHSKYAGAGRNVTGTNLNCVGSYHTGACVAFTRSNGNACFELAAFVKECCTCLGQCACVLTRNDNLREDVAKLVRHAFFGK